GLPVRKVKRLDEDISLNLKAASVRIVAPIPGKNTVGIEVPNELRADVRLKEVILASARKIAKSKIPLFLGKDAEGRPLVHDLAAFNELPPGEAVRRIDPVDDDERAKVQERMPYVVIFIDEMADLMMQLKKEVEGHIIRLAQKSRAAGIHLVVATQKPTVDVITGLIKSNLPARICFKVSNKSDSRVVLDEMGADKLLGKGDMLFLPPGTSNLVR